MVEVERFRRIRAVFEAVLAVSGDEPRRRQLEELTVGDAELEAEVGRLLRHYEEMSERVGEELPRFGPYRATRVIGSGGHGVVYEAERVDGEFDRRVAVKVLASGTLGQAAQEQLRAERQILAGLTHQGIAQLFDGGVTEAGEPYLVVEYVEGEHLEVYCEKHGLDAAGRLGLFGLILDAVGYAHRNGVVHRDLKPSNILVSKEGQPKLVDFGTAGPSRGVEGATGERSLTPGYASPEMMAGEAGDEAADVYALGVVYRDLMGKAGRAGVIAKATAALVAERYGSIEEMRAAIFVRPRRWRIAIGFVAMIACAVLAWTLSERPPRALQPRQISLPGESWRAATVSRDGRTVAYLMGDTRQKRELWVRAEGEKPVQLWINGQSADTPALSPDGRYVAYRSDEGPAGIWEFDRKTGKRRALAAGGHRPAYSPDGQWVLYATQDDRDDSGRSKAGIWRVRPTANGGEPRTVGGDLVQVRTALWENNDSILFFGVRVKGSAALEVWRHLWKPEKLELAARWEGSTTEMCGIRTGKEPALVGLDRLNLEVSEITMQGGSSRVRMLAKLTSTANSCATDGEGKVYLNLSRVMTSQHRLGFDGKLSTWEAPPERRPGWPWRLTSVSHKGDRLALTHGEETVVVDRTGTKVVGQAANYGELSGDGQILWTGQAGKQRLTRTPVSLNPSPLEVMAVPGSITALDREGGRALGYTSVSPRRIVLLAANSVPVEILRHPSWPVYRGQFSRDEKWVVFTAYHPKRGLLLHVAPFRGAEAVDPKEWIEVGEGTSGAFHPAGNRVYFTSPRDGRWCIYSVELDPKSMRPIGEAQVVAHLHGAYSPEQMPGSTFELQAAEDGLYFSLGRVEERLLRLE